jgi:hypothetical protein
MLRVYTTSRARIEQILRYRRRAVSRVALLLSVLVLGPAACDTDKPDTPAAATGSNAPHARVAGVYPDQWKCDTLATAESLAPILGGNVRVADSVAIPPQGVPHPCNYLVDLDTGTEAWTFDLDCRDHMKQRADALFAQYAQDSADQVSKYAAMADAGVLKKLNKPPEHHPGDVIIDAGPPPRAPEGAFDVPVGAKGLDHHGQGLIFIDDDAPCYVRVIGPDKDKRLALAQMLAAKLTFANAPMTPRPIK